MRHLQHSPQTGVESPQNLQVSKDFPSNTQNPQIPYPDIIFTTKHPTPLDPHFASHDSNIGTENLSLNCRRNEKDSEGQIVECGPNLDVLKGNKFGGQADKGVHFPKSASERTTASQKAKLRTIQRRREQNHIPRRIRNYTIKESDDPD